MPDYLKQLVSPCNAKKPGFLGFTAILPRKSCLNVVDLATPEIILEIDKYLIINGCKFYGEV